MPSSRLYVNLKIRLFHHFFFSLQDMKVELIDFREPELGQIYVTRIKWDKDSAALCLLLQERFHKFGLLHMVKADRSGNHLFRFIWGSILLNRAWLDYILITLFLDMGDWYAYVNFYSVTAAEKAYQAFHHCFPIQGSNCKVAQKKRELLKRGRMLVSLI